MQTIIHTVTDISTREAQATIKLAGKYLQQGELVGFPTETVYGLAADALNAAAVAKIFAAKGRPADNPLICHVDSIAMAEGITIFTPLAYQLAESFWPGPLTLVLPRRQLVPDITTAGLDTVAVRCPSHPVAQALIRSAATPLAAPSANLSGRPSPTLAEHVLEDMRHKIPLIIDAGAVEIGLESTVVDAREKYPRLLRPGQITSEQLAACCGDCLLPAQSADKPLSPGMKYRHYAPRGTLYLAANAEEALLIARRLEQTPLFLVSWELADKLRSAGINDVRIRPLFQDEDLAAYARAIFGELRKADLDNETAIIAEAVPVAGIGLAIMNRLNKAAAK